MNFGRYIRTLKDIEDAETLNSISAVKELIFALLSNPTTDELYTIDKLADFACDMVLGKFRSIIKFLYKNKFDIPCIHQGFDVVDCDILKIGIKVKVDKFSTISFTYYISSIYIPDSLLEDFNIKTENVKDIDGYQHIYNKHNVKLKRGQMSVSITEGMSYISTDDEYIRFSQMSFFIHQIIENMKLKLRNQIKALTPEMQFLKYKRGN